MRLLTYAADGGDARAGVLRGDEVVALERFPDLLGLIRAGDEGLAVAREALANGAGRPVAGVRLLCPLPVPEQVRCFSNFEQHGRNSAKVMLKKMAALAADPAAEEEKLWASGRFEVPPLFYEQPIYYKGNRFNWAGPDEDIVWPAYSQTVDYELELACIIGKGGKDIARDEASAHIFGYSVCNDLSARDAQAIEMRMPLGPAKGKDFDQGNIMGPVIVTADEIDPYSLTGSVKVDGEEWGRSQSSGMQHDFEACIAHVSRSETIHPGEVFLSGCFADGSAMELGRSLTRGVTLELEISGIGVLRNRIV